MEKHSSQPYRYKVGHVIRLESHRQNPASNCFASPDKKTKGKHTKCGWRTFWSFAYSKLVWLQDFIIIQSFTQSLNFKYNAHYYSVLIYIVINVTVRENCISAMTQFLVQGRCNPCQPGYTAPLKEIQCGLIDTSDTPACDMCIPKLACPIRLSILTLNSTVTETYTTAFPGLLGPGSCNLLPIWNCMHFCPVKLI